MPAHQDVDSTKSQGTPPAETDTIVHCNADGRIVIPRDVRRVLDLDTTPVKLTVHHENNSAQGVVELDKDGRVTIPVQLRRYLGIKDKALDLHITVSRIA